MAETGKEEVGGGNEVNDPPEWGEDATKGLENGRKQMESPVKEKNLGLMKTFRASLKVVSPMTLKSKRSENTVSDQSQPLNSPLRPQSSPSLSRGSPSQSSFRSPKAEKASVTRTMSDSAVGITGTLAKRGTSIRQSLGLSTKKHKREPLQPVTEAKNSSEELRSESVASIDRVLELRDTYTLPEIPPLPLSVMEINKLIEMEVLEEAYLNLLSLRLELQRERQSLDQEDCPIELVHKEKDLSLLNGTLRNKISAIVRDSSALPSHKQELLVYVAHIILEEEKRQGEPGAMQGWREAWRDAVRDGVRETLKNVHLDSREQNISWLAVHLGLLGKAVVEDLERVKTELLSSYPADFKVFETYVSCHHEAVGEHLKRLLEKVTELKDYYALLDFIIHRYPSDLKDKNNLIMEEDLLNKIKASYCHCQMDDFKSALENMITSEKEVWTMKKSPDRTEDGFLTSKTYMATCQLIASYAGNLEKIDENMVKSAEQFCLEELNKFHTRFEEEFSQHTRSLLTSDLLDCCLWIEYHISYINSFNSLKENVQCYRENCSSQVDQLEKEVDGLIQRLSQTLIKHFKTDVKTYMDGMMTKKWLKTNEDFKEVTSRIENYCGLCKSMRAPSAQVFVNDVHCYVAREYVSQLMKKKYSCKKTKNEDAAIKLREQWDELNKLFEDMGSSLNWLYPLGDHLSNIIGIENERKIKDLLVPLVRNYPDISKKQLSAVLYFRDNGFSLERHSVINQFTMLKRDAGNTNHDHSFFTDIEILS